MDIWNKEKRSECMSRIRSKNTKPELALRKALFARGLSRENIEGSIRVSFSNETTKQEVETFIEVFIDEYNKKFKEVIESGI